MLETRLLSALLEREWHDKASGLISPREFSTMGKLVFDAITEYYAKDEHCPGVDVELLRAGLLSEHPSSEADLIEYCSMLDTSVSHENVLDLLIGQKKVGLSRDIALAAGNRDTDKIDKLVAEYSALDLLEFEDNVAVYSAPNLTDLASSFSQENLIPLYPSMLNELVGGGVPRQSQIGIVARPDVGKSTVAMNLAVPACMNGYKVVYFGNEDPDKVMVLRAYTRFLQRKREDILANPSAAYETALDKGLGNFTFIGLDPGSIEDIRTHVSEIKPDLMVVDQLRNLRTGARERNMTADLNSLGQATRAIAKEYDLVSVIVTQAGDSAHNKLMLDINDVEYSNTGFAAQLDLMIGVGQNTDLKDMGKVMLSFAKNKLSEPINPFECQIDYAMNTLRTQV